MNSTPKPAVEVKEKGKEPDKDPEKELQEKEEDQDQGKQEGGKKVKEKGGKAQSRTTAETELTSTPSLPQNTEGRFRFLALPSDLRVLARFKMCEIEWSDEENWEVVKAERRSVDFTPNLFPGRSPTKKIKLNQVEEKLLGKAHEIPENKWNTLPDEIFIEIFKFISFRKLYTVAQVCKKWRQIARDAEFFKSPDFSSRRFPLDFKILLNILAKRPKQLNLSKVKLSSPTNYGNLNLSISCQALTELNLKQSQIREEELLIISKMLPNLITLDASWCTGLTNKVVESFTIHCPNLSRVNFSVTEIGDASVDALYQHAKQLKHMNLSWCTNITDVGALKLIHFVNNLQGLNLSGSHLLSEFVMAEVLAHCGNLVFLSLNDCNFVTEQMAIVIGQCQNLISLEISRCWKLTPPSIFLLVRSLPKLKHIQALGFPHATMRTLGEDFPQLTSVHTDYTSLRLLFPPNEKSIAGAMGIFYE